VRLEELTRRITPGEGAEVIYVSDSGDISVGGKVKPKHVTTVTSVRLFPVRGAPWTEDMVSVSLNSARTRTIRGGVKEERRKEKFSRTE